MSETEKIVVLKLSEEQSEAIRDELGISLKELHIGLENMKVLKIKGPVSDIGFLGDKIRN